MTTPYHSNGSRTGVFAAYLADGSYWRVLTVNTASLEVRKGTELTRSLQPKTVFPRFPLVVRADLGCTLGDQRETAESMTAPVLLLP